MKKSALRKPSFSKSIKALYVGILLKLLPHLINIFKHLSTGIRSEIAYLGADYTFQLKVEGCALECACRIDEKGRMHTIRPGQQTYDARSKSDLPCADSQDFCTDYTIAFRSIDYAFACFSGGLTLKGALAERAFSTRGPNNTGVALTYMFTALLRLFFFWRAPYRNQKPPRPIDASTKDA